MPRLWARFEVEGELYLAGVTMRDQSIAPRHNTEPQGAALRVWAGGKVVAVRVGFVRLTSTLSGGAVHVRSGQPQKPALLDLYACRFEGCKATDGCTEVNSDPFAGEASAGGAIHFGHSSDALIADSVFHGNRVSCLGGALFSRLTDSGESHSINIMRTEFTDNHVDNLFPAQGGKDIFVMGGDVDVQFQCPSPGKEVGPPLPVQPPPGVTCVFSDEYESLSVVLPNN